MEALEEVKGWGKRDNWIWILENGQLIPVGGKGRILTDKLPYDILNTEY